MLSSQRAFFDLAISSSSLSFHKHICSSCYSYLVWPSTLWVGSYNVVCLCGFRTWYFTLMESTDLKILKTHFLGKYLDKG